MEAQPGQAQPAQPAIPDSLNPHEAAGILSQMLESGQIQETGLPGAEPEKASPQPRDERGKFTKPEEAQPATEAEPKAEEAQPEETQPEIQEEKPKWTLKLKYRGEDKEVEQDEAVELAQKGYDYTQKMQGLAKEREEISAKVKAEQEQARKQFEQQLETYSKLVLKLADPEAMTANLAQIALQDPAKALQLQLKRQEIAETYNAVVAEQQKLAQQKESEARETFQKSAREAVEKLQDRIPNWNNKLYQDILDYGVSQGFPRQALNAVTDPVAIEVLNKARLYDELKAAKPKTVEKKVPPVAPKVQKPGAGEKTESRATKSQSAMAQLQKSGKRSDAEAYVLSMIEEGKLS